MRNLADWEGERVHFSGTLMEWKYLKHGEIAYLITNVEVRKWREKASRRVDHLWAIADVEAPLPEGYKKQRLVEIVMGGDVIKYKRLNGTWDYGVKPFLIADMRATMDRIVSTESLTQRAKVIRELRDRFNEGVIFFGWEENYVDVAKFLDQAVDDTEAIAQINERYERMAEAQWLSRGRVKPDPKIKGRKLAAASGFGR